MAEPAGVLVLGVLKQDCSVASCPYKYGDDSYGKKIAQKIEQKLKHRVADGNEVRALEKRVKELELGISRVAEWADKGKKLNQHDLAYLRSLIERKT